MHSTERKLNVTHIYTNFEHVRLFLKGGNSLSVGIKCK